MASPYATKLGPAPFRRWLLDQVPLPNVQRLKDLSDVMIERSKDIISEKRIAMEKGDEALLQQVGEGKDIMSILCALYIIIPLSTTFLIHLLPPKVKANMEASEKDQLTEEELLAQMS